MNKRDLIDALSGRLGDKKSATEALNAVLETIQSAVADGDKVAITGFGVFEKSDRPARTARNPATGAEIHVAAQSVPKFRPGADFKALVNGGGKPSGTGQAGRQGQEEVTGHPGTRQPAAIARRARALRPERTAARGHPRCRRALFHAAPRASPRAPAREHQPASTSPRAAPPRARRAPPRRAPARPHPARNPLTASPARW